MDNTHTNNRWPLAREGLPFVIISSALPFIFLYFGLVILAILAGILSLFVIFFFRDPYRYISVPDRAVLTPADGTVIEIRRLEDSNNPLGSPAVKISVFMSIFNVHVNRIPIGGVIKNITYNPGKFFSANLDKASKYNENNRLIIETPGSRRVVVIQIAGLIAKRISCWVNDGDHVVAGQRFGLIRFGSRLEVYLSGDSQITAQVRQKVKAGKTIIGYVS